jgi:hypothetical protein
LWIQKKDHFFSKKPKKQDDEKRAKKVELRAKKSDHDRGVASKIFRRLSTAQSSSNSSVNSA